MDFVSYMTIAPHPSGNPLGPSCHGTVTDAGWMAYRPRFYDSGQHRRSIEAAILFETRQKSVILKLSPIDVETSVRRMLVLGR